MNKDGELKLKKIILDGLKKWRYNKQEFEQQQEKLIDLVNQILNPTNDPAWKLTPLEAEVFWMVSKKTKKNFISFIKGQELTEEVQKEVKIIWQHIFNIIDSIYGKCHFMTHKTISEKISEEMRVWWQAVERFLIYAIKKYSTNKNLEIWKSKSDFEEKKLDFIIDYKKDGIKIKMWVQLTTLVNVYVDKKRKSLIKVSDSLDKPIGPSTDLNDENFKKEDIPDLVTLLSIKNGNIKFNNSHNGDNPFNKAYISYIQDPEKTNILDKIWYNSKQKKDNYSLLKLISSSYPDVVKYFMKNIKDINLHHNYNPNSRLKSIKLKQWEINYSYNKETNIFKINFSKEWKYIFFVEFFITKKFLNKIWHKQKNNFEVKDYRKPKVTTPYKKRISVYNKNKKRKNKKNKEIKERERRNKRINY